jgi:circadian clock protein KaiB
VNEAAIIADRTIPGGGEYWDLQLYVAGQSPNSVRALANLRELCEQHMRGHYQIDVTDLAEEPYLARRDEIVAIPTLVRRFPEPACRIIGDLSDNGRVLAQLRQEPSRSPRDASVSTSILQARIVELEAANDQLSEQFVKSNIAEQASGAISVQYGMSQGDAFKLLCGMASSQRRSLDDIATETLDNRGRFSRPPEEVGGERWNQ